MQIPSMYSRRMSSYDWLNFVQHAVVEFRSALFTQSEVHVCILAQVSDVITLVEQERRSLEGG